VCGAGPCLPRARRELAKALELDPTIEQRRADVVAQVRALR
jgi:hypothetical protein